MVGKKTRGGCTLSGPREEEIAADNRTSQQTSNAIWALIALALTVVTIAILWEVGAPFALLLVAGGVAFVLAGIWLFAFARNSGS